MEERDLDLIRELAPANPELDQLYSEHLELEKQLEEFDQRRYLTPEEQVERKRLQKTKLAGRDRIEAILAAYRAQASA